MGRWIGCGCSRAGGPWASPRDSEHQGVLLSPGWGAPISSGTCRAPSSPQALLEWNHRIVKAGKALQDQPAQPSPYHQCHHQSTSLSATPKPRVQNINADQLQISSSFLNFHVFHYFSPTGVVFHTALLSPDTSRNFMTGDPLPKPFSGKRIPTVSSRYVTI